jgi:putative glutamine transport system permease protein
MREWMDNLTNIFGPRKWQELWNAWDEVMAGWGLTIRVSLISLVFALLIGAFVGLLMATERRRLKKICQAYITFFQNTPLTIQLILFYFVLMPAMGMKRMKVEASLLALSIYTGAYCANIFYSAIVSVPAGQFEAASSQGFGFARSMAYIILPQAIQIALPSLTNQAVNLIKNSSVMALVTARDLMYTLDIIASNNDTYGPPLLMTGLLYLCMCLPLSMLARRLERRLIRHG